MLIIKYLLLATYFVTQVAVLAAPIPFDSGSPEPNHDASWRMAGPSVKQNRLHYRCTRCQDRHIKCDHAQPNCTPCQRKLDKGWLGECVRPVSEQQLQGDIPYEKGSSQISGSSQIPGSSLGLGYTPGFPAPALPPMEHPHAHDQHSQQFHVFPQVTVQNGSANKNKKKRRPRSSLGSHPGSFTSPPVRLTPVATFYRKYSDHVSHAQQGVSELHPSELHPSELHPAPVFTPHPQYVSPSFHYALENPPALGSDVGPPIHNNKPLHPGPVPYSSLHNALGDFQQSWTPAPYLPTDNTNEMMWNPHEDV